MSLTVTIDVSGYSAAQVATLRGKFADRAALNARVATDAEAFVKARGKATSSSEHKTANRLGGRPTGHLTKAYEAIQHVSDATSATLLVPRASRLRAAFGRYTLVPGEGRKYLTIPMAAEAYGKRAREFSDLHPIRSKAGNLILARTDAAGNIEPMYALVKQASIPEDAGLIPFNDLADEARDSAAAYYDEALAASLQS